MEFASHKVGDMVEFDAWLELPVRANTETKIGKILSIDATGSARVQSEDGAVFIRDLCVLRHKQSQCKSV